MLDIEALRAEISATIFNKGEQLLARKKVAVKSRDAHSIDAKVSGQLVYQVKLEVIDGSIFRSQCSCPAFAYQSLCKHCVATALAFNQTDEQCFEVEDDEQKIRHYLRQKTPEQLVDQLMDFVLDDPVKYKRLLFQIESASKTYTSADLNKLLTKALPMRDVWEYNKVYDYFQHAQEVFDVFVEHAAKLPASEYFALIDKACARLDKALQRVDDSGGYRYGLVELLAEQSTQTFLRLDWSDKKKANWIIDNIINCYDYITTPYIEYLQTDALRQAFLQSCQDEVDKIEVPIEITKRERDWGLYQLIQPLLEEAISKGDVHKQAKLLAKNASCIRDLVKISELYLISDDEFSAQDWLVKAQKLPATDNEKRELQVQQVKVDAALGNKQQAWDIAWQCFIEQPDFQSYLQLEQHILLTGCFDDNYLSKVEDSLLKNTRRHSAVALEFYLHHNRLEDAAKWAISNDVEYNLLAKLSFNLIESAPKQAIICCQRSISDLVKTGNNQVYAQAISYLTKFEEKWLNKPQDENLLKILIKDLLGKFSAKRNFVKSLNDNFSQYLE